MLVLSRKVGERIAVGGNVLVSVASADGKLQVEAPAGVAVELRDDPDSRSGKTVVIDNQITVKVVNIVRDQVKLGIQAPREMLVVREELLASAVRPTE
jgi:carbon storage regulator CsrA